MKSTIKDALIGVAFAFGYAVVALGIGGLFISSYNFAIILSSPLVTGLLGIPIYFICKRNRGWHFCVSAAATSFLLATSVWLPVALAIIFHGDVDTFLLSLYVLACYTLPSLLDGLIHATKRIWRWLGSRTAI
ncbi:MAG: hypothetical protein IJX76_06895 [Clostridia bacterium]|nr:hypothetical protein [Clostridia bacterium]